MWNMFTCGWTDRLGGGLDRQVDWMDRRRGRTGRSIYETTAVYSLYMHTCFYTYVYIDMCVCVCVTYICKTGIQVSTI